MSDYAFATRDEYSQACAAHRQAAVQTLGRERFKYIIGGLEVGCEVVGCDPSDGHVVCRATETIGGVEQGELIHFEGAEQLRQRLAI